MSKKYSGRIHDPNHELSDYDLYFNDTLLSGTGIYTSEELADIFGSSTATANPIVVDNAAPMYPVKMETVRADEITINVWNKNMMTEYMPLEAYPTSQAQNITAVANSDGSITINGTPTAQTDFYLQSKDMLTDIYDGLSIIISGCPSGGGASTYRFQIVQTLGSSTNYANDDGSGATVTGRSSTRFRIRIASGYTCSNLTFYPMVRLASFSDDTYVTPEKQEYTFNLAADSDPVNVLDYAPVRLYEGENVIKSSSGNIEIEYIQK